LHRDAQVAIGEAARAFREQFQRSHLAANLVDRQQKSKRDGGHDNGGKNLLKAFQPLEDGPPRICHHYDDAGMRVASLQAGLPERCQIITVAAVLPDQPGKHSAIALSQQLRPSLGTRRDKAGCAIDRLKICAHHAVMLGRFFVTPEILFIQLAPQQTLCFRQGGQHGGCQFPLQEE